MNRRDIQDLIEAGIIDHETGDRITDFYIQRDSNRPNLLILGFGILGAILVGLGIILILAHNWDNIPRSFKTVLAVVPMLAGQAACWYSLRREEQSRAWSEGSSVFLFFAIGAAISLIGQIYHLPGSMKGFLLTWMLLTAPLIYVMRSMTVSLFYIIGVTIYSLQFLDQSSDTNWYWLLILIPIPFYFYHILKKPKSRGLIYHHWVIPLSLSIYLTYYIDQSPWITVAYVSLFAIFYVISRLPFFKELPLRQNGYLVIASIGTLGVLLPTTYEFIWEEVQLAESNKWAGTKDAIAAIVLTAAAGLANVYFFYKNRYEHFHPLQVVFLCFMGCYILALHSISPVIITNILVLFYGIYYAYQGNLKRHFLILNYGLLMITFLIIFRFFDFSISYVLRGLLFVFVGLAFFYANYRMYQREEI